MKTLDALAFIGYAKIMTVSLVFSMITVACSIVGFEYAKEAMPVLSVWYLDFYFYHVLPALLFVFSLAALIWTLKYFDSKACNGRGSKWIRAWLVSLKRI